MSNLCEHEFYSLDFIHFFYKDNKKRSLESKLQTEILVKKTGSLYFLSYSVCQLHYPYLTEPECRKRFYMVFKLCPKRCSMKMEVCKKCPKEGVDRRRNVEEVRDDRVKDTLRN